MHLSALATSQTTPDVSLIVPVYNVAGFVGPCIASIRAQDVANFEAIIVDDGSTDTSLPEIWAAVDGDPRFRVVSRENGGLSAARNTGLELARAPLIGFVDSDDRIAPSYLSSLMTALEETGADWAACAVRFCIPDGSSHDHPAIHGRRFPVGTQPGTSVFEFRDWSDVIPHFPSAWNKLYRRNLIDGMRYIEGTYFEDHPFFYHAARRTDRLAYVPEPLYWQTQGRAGQITRESSARIFEQFNVLDEIERQMRQTDRPGTQRALSRIATRLIIERAETIDPADTALQARYFERALDYLSAHDLSFDFGWDTTLDPLWAWRLRGRTPLSLIVVVDSTTPSALSHTLSTLSQGSLPGAEIVFVPGQVSDAALQHLKIGARRLAHATVLEPVRGLDLKSAGLLAARGDFAIFLHPGDAPPDAHSLRRRLLALDGGAPDPAFQRGAPDASQTVYRIWRWRALLPLAGRG